MNDMYFFIAGAQRCGTTYLYHLLDSHPEICMAKPVKPEPKFFINKEEFAKGKAYYQKKYFANTGKTCKAHGEKSTSYIEYPDVADRIKDFFPNGKIILSLRNPIDRAISNYFFSLNNQIETRTLEEVFLNDAPIQDSGSTKNISVSPFLYKERGEYLNYIRPFVECFGHDNVKVIIFENFVGQIEKIQELYRFLSVSPDYVPGNVNQAMNRSEKSFDIPDAVRKKLFEYFRRPNLELSEYLNIDLEDIWK